MAQIIINGKSYVGNSISISKNQIIVNGTKIVEDSKIINISIEGNVDSLNVDSCEKVVVHGFVHSVSTMSGDVECLDVKKDVKTMSGSVECGNVSGDVSTASGDVKAKTIGGSVKTSSGDIKYKQNP